MLDELPDLQMNTYTIWKLGIPLGNSWRHFASANQRSKYNQLQEKHGGLAYVRQFNEVMDRHMDQFATNPSLEYPELPPMKFSLVSDLESQLKAQTLGWIQKGDLIGYGYEKPRSAMDIPVRVPEDLWSHIIVWHKSTLTADSLTIESVRLVHCDHVLGPEQSDLDNKRPPGRPSRRAQIVDAYEILKRRCELDFSKSLGQHYSAIKRQVLLVNPNDTQGAKGLGKEVVRQTLREQFEKDLQIAAANKL